MTRPFTLATAVMLTAFFLPSAVVPAYGQALDARSVGMAGVSFSTRNQPSRLNPASRALPRELRARHSVRVPFFLLQQWDERPTIDAERTDFDLTHLAQWMVGLPAGLQFRRQSPLSETVRLEESGGEWFVPRSDVRSDLPPESFTRGETIEAFDLGYELDVGERYGVLHLSAVQGFVVHQAHVQASGSYDEVLDGGTGLTQLDASGFMAAGFSYGVTYAREITLGPAAGAEDFAEYFDQADARPRLWFGASLRRLNGLVYTRTEGLTTLASVAGDPSSISLDTSMNYEWASAEGFSGWGGGFAGDLGAILRWGTFELGVGVADIGASLRWSDASEVIVTQDSAALTTPTARDTVLDLPTRWRAHLRRLLSSGTVVLVEGGEDAGGFSARAAAESSRGAWTWRGGVEYDTRQTWQLAGGASLHQGRWQLDLGLRTHSGNLDASRGLALAAGVSWLR